MEQRRNGLGSTGWWSSFARLRAWLLAAIAAFALPGFAWAQDSKGTDFWLMFNENLGTPTLSLFITGSTATTGTVSVPGLATPFTQNFSVTPGTVTTVALPSDARATGADSIQNLGVRVTAGEEVSVYGLNRVSSSTDAFLGLPVDILGTSYINLTYGNPTATFEVRGSQIGIVATQNGTTVTITPSAIAGNIGSLRAAGVAYSITLNQGQTYQLRTTELGADLTGTIVTSDKPIAVFGSNQCAKVPTTVQACDHLVEQLPPTSTWGKSFATMPLATRLRGDTFRILAGTNDTQVSINGALVATLQRGQFYEQIIAGPAVITATQPVLVAQYSNGSFYDNVTSDPFMMLIPPYEQFLGAYTVTTPATGFTANYINVVAPSAAVGAITLDGSAVPAASFTPIGSSGFSGAQLPVALGAHSLAGPLPFGVFVYGFANFDSYGYPGGQSLARVANVIALDVTPKTATNPVGTQHCVDGKVTDQSGAPVPGVRIDFVVTGANPNSGFVTSDANGTGRYCYNGPNPGVDSIVGSVGTLTSTASKTWVQQQATCDVDMDGDIDKNDLALISRARGQTAQPGDPRDSDRDGRITPNDVKVCITRCTRPNCAIQ